MVPPLAASAAEYAVLTCPPGKDEVIIWTGATTVATAMLRALVAVFAVELESVTFAVNEIVPDAVGVPLI